MLSNSFLIKLYLILSSLPVLEDMSQCSQALWSRWKVILPMWKVLQLHLNF